MSEALEYSVHLSEHDRGHPIAPPSNGLRHTPARFPALHLQPGGQDVVYRLEPQVRERQATQIEFAPGVYASSALPHGAQSKSCTHSGKVAIGKIYQPLRAMAASSSKGDVTSVPRQRNANGSIGVEEGAGDAT